MNTSVVIYVFCVFVRCSTQDFRWLCCNSFSHPIVIFSVGNILANVVEHLMINRLDLPSMPHYLTWLQQKLLNLEYRHQYTFHWQRWSYYWQVCRFVPFGMSTFETKESSAHCSWQNFQVLPPNRRSRCECVLSVDVVEHIESSPFGCNQWLWSSHWDWRTCCWTETIH